MWTASALTAFKALILKLERLRDLQNESRSIADLHLQASRPHIPSTSSLVGLRDRLLKG